MIEQVADLLGQCDSADSVMPPTELFNEGWLLRVVLDWYSRQPTSDSPLAFERGAKWYSEGRLSSPFLKPKTEKQSSHEGYTHADGFIGHFDVCPGKSSEIKPKLNATQLVVVEAKLGSGLSPGTTNAPDYDQAARNACCLVHIASEAGITPGRLAKLAFYVVAPKSQVDNRKFESLVTKPSIQKKVRKRALNYKKEEGWYKKEFSPFLKVMCVKLITWEDILSDMESFAAGTEYRAFYDKCKRANSVK